MRRVLVTGASGFIGRQVLPLLLDRSYEVHALGRRRTAATDRVVWHDDDILQPRRAKQLLSSVRPSHVLHLAWYAVPGKFWDAAENDGWAEASAHFFAAGLETGVSRIVGVGTCAEYRWSNEPCSETTTPLEPVTRYGQRKLEAFRALMDTASRGGASAGWARLFHMYGPYEHPDRLVPRVIHTLRSGREFVCTSGDHLRDFLHVRDVAGALVAILDGSMQGAVNVASGEAVPVRRVVETVAQVVGREDLVAFTAGEPGPIDPPVLTADVTRLCNEIGWKPLISLERGLEDTVRWWESAAPVAVDQAAPTTDDRYGD